MPRTHERASAGLVHAGFFLDQVLDRFEAQARIDRVMPENAISEQADYLKRLGTNNKKLCNRGGQ